ncbi:hypothetical protein [Sphingomonas immobilis]|uniref:Small multidrug resistance family-3 protein n=1 Tax=Sphingomonas immobilis TaxID=3063997 RepID=A0ABT8ZTJ0_9SPHN|nr:hypothetical protein [Sphingomonas sp. CA1-15]MDO7840883.1 hypothetical protein [Sphingomonas sp. CA1-15]
MPAFLSILLFLIAATVLEVSGDAIVRMGIARDGLVRGGFFAAGAVLLFAYGLLLNLAPLPFERVVGIYIATLFIVWQVIAYITFRHVPGVPVYVGGALIVAGGLTVAFWKG